MTRNAAMSIVMASLVLVVAACSDTATTAPSATSDGSTTTTGAATSTSSPSSTTTRAPTSTEAATTTTASAGPAAPVGSYRVTGVAADDVLNIRNGPGVNNPIVGVFAPNGLGVRTTGSAADTADGGLWWEVELFVTPDTGWVNSSFLAPYDDPPCSNNDGALALANVFVESPRPGARVPSGFLVRGCSRSFESTFGWRLFDGDGNEIADGFAMGGGVDGPGTFEFTVDYSGVVERQIGLLDVTEDDASGGEGPPPVRNVIPLFLTPDGGPEPVNPPDPCSNSDGALDDAFGIIVTTPFSGQRVRTGFALEGCSNTFEAAVPWQLLDREGEIIAEGFTMGGGVEFQPFTDTVEFNVSSLQIGTLVVNEEDVSDGEGPPPVRNEIPVVLTP